MSEWQPRTTIPEDGTEVRVQSVGGNEPDDGEVFFDGKARFENFLTGSVIDPLTGEIAIPANTSSRWVRSDVGKVVPGRIVRWKSADV